MNRRSFFGMLLAPLVVPVVSALPRTKPSTLITTKDNPLLSGALGEWKGFILFDPENGFVSKAESDRDELADWFSERMRESVLEHVGPLTESRSVSTRFFVDGKEREGYLWKSSLK